MTLLFSTLTIGKGQTHVSILSAPEDWKSEIIPFPIGFAQSIDYKGFEELRFAPAWSDRTSKQFWTHMFVWYIEADSLLTEKKLTRSMEAYYDGLMKMDIPAPNDSIVKPRTQAIFIKTEDGFKGKINLFDAFFSKKPMTLFAKVTDSYCDKTNKQILRFELSQRYFDNEIWKIFNEVKVMVDCE